MSHEEMHCLRSYVVCKFQDSGYVYKTWLLKRVARQIFSEQEKLLLAELGKKAKATTARRWPKRQRHGMLKIFI